MDDPWRSRRGSRAALPWASGVGTGGVCACEGQHLPGEEETPTLRSLVSEKPLLSGLALLKSTPVVLKPSYVPVQS